MPTDHDEISSGSRSRRHVEAPPLPRHLFGVAERFWYLNHAGVSPIPRGTADAIAEAADDYFAGGVTVEPTYDDRCEATRVSAARLMGVPPVDVAFVKNTTEGLAFVANGIDWRDGDRVVVPDLEFPSTIYPWLALRDAGVTVERLVPVGTTRALPLEVFAKALDEAPTRLVAVSWVQFGRGWRTDLAALAELCHEHGALLCADVIQGLGVIPCELESWGVDFAMADSHKWMLGPVGIGVMYVAERCRDLLRPSEPGWASVVHREQWDNLDLVYDDSARRYEGGTPNQMTITGMGASIDLLLEVGVERIWPHVDALCDRLVASLESIGATVLSDRSPQGRSAIVTFSIDGHDPTVLQEQLRSSGVVCSARGGGVRLSPHGYNTRDEIDEVVSKIHRLAATR